MAEDGRAGRDDDRREGRGGYRRRDDGGHNRDRGERRYDDRDERPRRYENRDERPRRHDEDRPKRYDNRGRPGRRYDDRDDRSGRYDNRGDRGGRRYDDRDHRPRSHDRDGRPRRHDERDDRARPHNADRGGHRGDRARRDRDDRPKRHDNRDRDGRRRYDDRDDRAKRYDNRGQRPRRHDDRDERPKRYDDRDGRGRRDRRDDRPRRDHDDDRLGRDGKPRRSRDGLRPLEEREAGHEGPIRRGESDQAPDLPEGVEYGFDQLDKATKAGLRSLNKQLAEAVGNRLIAAAALLAEDDIEGALEQARYARRKASRVAIVREVTGVAAYGAEQWQLAMNELRAAQRLGGNRDHVAMIADCERAIGHPERAIDLYREFGDDTSIDPEVRVELLIVASGSRRDMGLGEAATAMLKVAALNSPKIEPWVARLRYAYAEGLLADGRDGEARDWLSRAVAADASGETGAAERLLELEGVDFDDVDADDDGSDDEREDEADTGGVGDGATDDGDDARAQEETDDAPESRD